MTASKTTPPLVPPWEFEWRVISVVSEWLGYTTTATIGPESRFHEEIRIDSLDIIGLIMELEEAFQVSMPDEWCERVFTSPQQATFRALAAAIYERIGTGAPPPPRPVPLAASRPEAAPFLQLGGRVSKAEWLDGPLYQMLGVNANGLTEHRRLTDGMRCIALPAADVVPSGSGSEPGKVPVAPCFMDAEPVSNLAYSRFLNSIGKMPPGILLDWCGAAADDRRGSHFGLRRSWGRWVPHYRTARQPVILVSWYGAAAYALWAHRYDWRYFRGDGTVSLDLESIRVDAPPPTASVCLPSELQWEYAARGTEPRRYPWGDDDPAPELLRAAQHQQGQSYTAESLPAADVCDRLGMSPFGLHHMAGNVWQWCRNWYHPGETPVGEAEPTGIRSERGGSWVGPAKLAECGYRRGRPPYARGRCLGFRCVGVTEC